MSEDLPPVQAAVPSVDRLMRLPPVQALIATYGRASVADAVRGNLAALRERLTLRGRDALPEASEGAIVARLEMTLEAESRQAPGPVFNLTGTVLHTNLGRAPLPPEAIEAMARVSEGASNLEYDLTRGRRGDRESYLEGWLCRLTGAEAASVVNNNAAAVLLALNTLALRKEVVVSRGELIEIGDSFRMPDLMARSGCKLREVGTTNRTHLRDYEDAIGPRTSLIMKVHTSNYVVEGFTATVGEKELASVAHGQGLALIVDLGSGTLVDLGRYGLPHEPTATESLANGADLVTFSGDKLLGGPQAGIILGRKPLIAKLRRNPMKRALRVDKMTVAALGSVLGLYADPDRLPQRLPALRDLTRPAAEIEALARRLMGPLSDRLSAIATVKLVPCQSQIGSGALPGKRLASVALAIQPKGGKAGRPSLTRIASAFRALPKPVIGRAREDAYLFDLRCLDDEAGFVAQLANLPSKWRARP